MADSHRPGGEERSVTPAEEPGMPRWVKVSLIIAAAVAALIVILLLFGGDHGPSRHMTMGASGDTSTTTRAP